jgi:hypothetical protein
MGRQRLDLKEAAEALGVTSEAVRKRAKRGTLPSDTGPDGRMYVWVDSRVDGGSDTGWTPPVSDKDAHISSLEDQVSFLRAELVTRNEELRRKDHLLAALTERIPELEASPEPSESPVTVSGTSDRDGERPSWLRRFFEL